MSYEIYIQRFDNGTARICLTVPAGLAVDIANYIYTFLSLKGEKIIWHDNNDEELIPISQAMPDLCPAKILKGFRLKQELTQKAFASRIGISQHRVSEMENGKRLISVDMAKRIGEVFSVPYKLFLQEERQG